MRMTREKQDGAEEADDGGVEPPQDNAEDGDEATMANLMNRLMVKKR